MSCKELPKIINKTQADIDANIDSIQACDLPCRTKEFVISCIRLAIWLPNALLEQKIKLANLRKLIFGIGKKSKIKKNDAKESATTDKNATESNKGTLDKEAAASVENETLVTKNKITKPGHGRLPHTAYLNTTDHQLSIAEYQSGDSCPMLCNGKLYYIDPGVVVRVKGKNLAAVHKYWIEKLRCALCGYIVSANVPNHICQEKYDARRI
jgi:transposase